MRARLVPFRSEQRAQIDGRLLALLEHAVHGAKQAGFGRSGNSLAGGRVLNQARRDRATGMRLLELLLAFLRGLAAGFRLRLNELRAAIRRSEPLEALRSGDQAARVDLVILDELGELGCHAR